MTIRTRVTIGAVLFTMFGIFSLVGLVQDMNHWAIFHPDGIYVSAVVTGNDERVNTRGSVKYGNHMNYYPVVSYEVNGNTYEDIRILLDRPRHSPAEVGSVMLLSVSEKNPEIILKDLDWMTYVWAALTFTSLFVGIFALYKILKR